jgi:hypothetical protein
MNKCSPVEMRVNLELVEEMRKVGMDFVPVPVFGEADKKHYIALMREKLNVVYEMVNNENLIK